MEIKFYHAYGSLVRTRVVSAASAHLQRMEKCCISDFVADHDKSGTEPNSRGRNKRMGNFFCSLQAPKNGKLTFEVHGAPKIQELTIVLTGVYL